MAGKRQHYIPVFLQSSFASRKNGGINYAWLYRRDKAPFETNLRNIGVEGGFYSRDDDSMVDTLITDFEQTLHRTVSSIVASPNLVTNLRGEVATLIAHLEIRTRHIRQSFVESSEYV